MRFKTFYIKEQEFKFDFNQLNSLDKFSQRIKFAKEHLKEIGHGSSRVVFELSPYFVLKLAKNEKGLIQNSTETDKELHKTYSDIIPNLKDFDKNDYWLVVEKCNKVSKEKFKQLSGINFDLFGKALKEVHYLQNGRIEELSDDVKELENSDNYFFELLKKFMEDFDMFYKDLANISSWGESKGKLKLIDYGLTQEAYDTYFRKN